MIMEFKNMVGKTITKIYKSDCDALLFECSDGTRYVMYHEQDCCEAVYIEDICGELHNLIGSPIIMAEESFKYGEESEETFVDSETWTFYKFATIKGYVTVRWYGTSNGYYSESAGLYQVDVDSKLWKEFIEDTVAILVPCHET